MPIRIPGMAPAKKSAPMETPVREPYKIISILGGMIGPMHDDVQVTAIENSGS